MNTAYTAHTAHTADTVRNGAVVSIVLPVQGTDAALDRVVQSVRAQTEQDWQLYLVEPAGVRGRASRWAAHDGRIQVLRQEGRGGRAAALRLGLQHCLGTYTVFLDAEHVWAPYFLALTRAFLDAFTLEDLVCMASVTPAGQPAAVYRRADVRGHGRLDAVLDPSALRGLPDAAAGAVWQQGELARHLRWGEYTRLAVTLLRTEEAERLLPALYEDTEALEYRLQARLAARSAVNVLALPGAVFHAAGVSPEVARQREIDALAVFDEVHGRQWETDPEVARLRRERLARIDQRAPLGALGVLGAVVARCLGWSRQDRPARALPADLGGPQVGHPH